MLKVIKQLLLKIVDDIDSGNSNITEDEEIDIIELLKSFRKDTPMSKYQAYTYLNMSRASFDNLVKAHKLPYGVKLPGFKEKFWYRKDLDKYIKNNG